MRSVDLTKENFIIKITDLGLARELSNFEDDLIKSYCGTVFYMSPELANEK